MNDGQLQNFLPFALSLQKVASGMLGVTMDTIVSDNQPAERGPFVLDTSFFSNASGFFTADKPDAAYVIGGPANGTYIFRPCFYMPPELSSGIVGIECDTMADLCAYDQCNASCVWRDVVRYDNNLPTIFVAFDDPCFQQYPPAPGEGVGLYAWVATDSTWFTTVSITMERGIKFDWVPLHVELQSPAGGWATGYSARSMVDSGSSVTALPNLGQKSKRNCDEI